MLTQGALVARQARSDQFDVVMELLAESIQWLRSKGLDQWSTWEQWRTKMAPSLERGDVWLFCDGEDLIGTVTVELGGDADFWTTDELGEPAAYVSKLAVRRDRAGSELGALLLDWAAENAYRRGCSWLRIDAWKNNERLHAYYSDRGWTYLRTNTNPRRRSGALFQRPARALPTDRRGRIQEDPKMPVLSTTALWPEGPDVAGNWQASHTHSSVGLIVDYRWVGQRPAVLLPGMRYRVRQDGALWAIEAQWDKESWWERHGTVAHADFPLVPGQVYVISHQDGEPCEMVIINSIAVDLGL